MSPDIVDMFASIAENAKTSTEADKLSATAVKGRYGNKATGEQTGGLFRYRSYNSRARIFPSW